MIFLRLLLYYLDRPIFCKLRHTRREPSIGLEYVFLGCILAILLYVFYQTQSGNFGPFIPIPAPPLAPFIGVRRPFAGFGPKKFVRMPRSISPASNQISREPVLTSRDSVCAHCKQQVQLGERYETVNGTYFVQNHHKLSHDFE